MGQVITVIFVLLMWAVPSAEAWAAQEEKMGSLRGTVRDGEGKDGQWRHDQDPQPE